MIERALKKLQAKPPKSGDVLPRGGKPSLAVSEVTRVPPSDTDFQRNENGIMKRSGTPTLGMGHDWGWMPQRAMEIRNSVHSVIDLGAKAGAVSLKVEHAQIYVVQPSAAISLLFDTSGVVDTYGREGVNVDFLVMIENPGGFGVTVNVNHWAPTGAAPNLNRAGFFELLVSIALLPSRQISRGYPCIQDVT
jgi:hypothetical protein